MSKLKFHPMKDDDYELFPGAEVTSEEREPLIAWKENVKLDGRLFESLAVIVDDNGIDFHFYGEIDNPDPNCVDAVLELNENMELCVRVAQLFDLNKLSENDFCALGFNVDESVL